MTREEFETHLGAHGFAGPSEVRLDPGERREPHTHDFAVRGLVTHGALILFRNGGADHYKIGDFFEMEQECAHFEAAGPGGAVYLVGRRHEGAA